uniref:FAD-binding PCMH-type domain-containing protein n=1 Tax=Fagus sylvatica TaxID=28930 RepID=A0A2N9EP70_FAGSY
MTLSTNTLYKTSDSIPLWHQNLNISSYLNALLMSKLQLFVAKTIACKKVKVNLRRGTAWVQAGATLGELFYGIAKESSSLGFPAGTCPTIGVGGHFSGGGQGEMMRKFGLSADNVVDAILVKANGEIVNRESMGEDLFWAIRGGGDKLQEELTIRIIITVGTNANGGKTIRASFQSLFLGTIDQLMPLMEESFPELGLEVENCKEMSWIESVLYLNGEKPGESIELLLDRSHNLNKGFFKAKSDYVKNPISETGLEAIWKVMQIGEAGIMIWTPYGGKMSEILPSETPFPHRAGILFNIQYYSKWNEEGNVTKVKHLDWINKLYYFMTTFVSKNPRAAYLNYRDLDIGINIVGTFAQAKVWGEKYFKGNFKRLAVIKGEVDPENYFKNEQSIMASS